MISSDLDQLRNCLHESKLKFDFAYNFLREVETDGVVGPDHDEALYAALRAMEEALTEYARLQELFIPAVHKNIRTLPVAAPVERPEDHQCRD
jgi:hypothetical protein